MELIKEAIHPLKTALLIGNVILFGVIMWLITEISSQTNAVILYRAQYDKVTSIEAKVDEVHKQINETGGQANLYKDYLTLINEDQVVMKQYLSTQKNLQSKIFYKYIPEHKKAISVSINHTNNLITQNEANIAWAQEAAKQTPDENKLNNLLQEANKKAAIVDTSLVEQDKEAQGLEARVAISHLWGIYVLSPISILTILLFGGSFLLFVKIKRTFILILLFVLGVCNLLGFFLLSTMIFL